MKKLITLIALVLITIGVKAQDIITLTNGTVIKAVVTEVNTTEVKFKKSATGPLYVMAKTDIASIAYENGTTDVFNADQSTTATTTTSTTTTEPAISKLGKYNGNDDGGMDMRKHYGGPRIGFTAFEDGLLSQQIHSNCVSQFGWQFETRFFTLPDGGSGLFEFVPMVGGMEKGLFLPSASTLIGFRAGNGFELGMGPNLSRSGLGMVFALGGSFSAGHVCFPINIAFQPGIDKRISYGAYNSTTGYYEYHETTRNTGFRVSLLIGFNSRTK